MKLLKYIQGFRKGKEAHRIEKEAMRDPFLSDALEGFDSVQDDHGKAIEAMRREMTRRSNGNKRQRLIRGWGVAASLLLCAFLGGYLLLKNERIAPEILVLERDTLHQPSPSLPQLLPKENISQARETEKQEHTRVRQTGTGSPDATHRPAPTLVPEEIQVQEEVFLSDEQAEKIQEIPVTDTYGSVVVPPAEDASATDTVPLSERVIRQSQPERDRITASRTPAPASADRIRGQIVSATDGNPIIGASVRVEGTAQGTITDMDGYFELTTDAGEKLRVDYIGFNSLSLTADSGSTMMIAMQEDTSSLEEVVVTGHGASAKRQTTGSVQKKPVTEQIPEPVIGKRKYEEYLRSNLQRPLEDECASVKGKITVAFYVNEQGRPYDIRIEKGLCHSADEEAIRLVREGPKWEPGSGKATVVVRF